MKRRQFFGSMAAASLQAWIARSGYAETRNIAETSATPIVSVKTDLDAPGHGVDPHFLGLSYEKNRVASSLFSSSDSKLVHLLKTLGVGVLRVGGSSVDTVTWNESGSGDQRGSIAPADIDRLAVFVRASNWQILYGLNMGSANPAAAAAEAAYASRAFGTSLLGIEIGNEPDLYHRSGLRPSHYSYEDFSREWTGFARAISAKTPRIPITGPASAIDVFGYTLPFAREHARDITLLTQHYYRGDGRSAKSTLNMLLSADSKLPEILGALAGATKANPIKLGYRLAEANSFYAGGAPNVSDSNGSALWVLDFLIVLAMNGASGVNFHGGGNGTGYNPIGDDGSSAINVRPELYGMLLFSKLAGCNLFLTTVACGSLNVTGCGAVSTNGTRLLVMVNKEPTQAIRVRTSAKRYGAPVRIIRLLAAPLQSELGTLIGGSPISLEDSWTPTVETAWSKKGTLEFDLPAASAALVEQI
jgi:hypothetical protein